MGELTTHAPPAHVDAAVQAARHTEDLLVGDQIVRHRYASRAIHWSVAVSIRQKC